MTLCLFIARKSTGVPLRLSNRFRIHAGQTQNHDLAGRLTLTYSPSANASYKYEYDHLDRLTAVYDATGVTRKATFTYDALGRRIKHINDRTTTTTRYCYDGDNEIVEYNQNDARQRWYVPLDAPPSRDAGRAAVRPADFVRRGVSRVHGLAYIDERLMLVSTSHARRFFYIQDRLYNVWAMIDRAGAIVERYAYDAYGLPLIRESAGRGDMDSDTDLDSTDASRVASAVAGSIWDPRADLNDDGVVNSSDQTAYNTKKNSWPPTAFTGPTVAQAHSDVDNPFMFQGVRHFALDTPNATSANLPLNQHRLRFMEPWSGRWTTRDPIEYDGGTMNLFEFVASNPILWLDPFGLEEPGWNDNDFEKLIGGNGHRVGSGAAVIPANHGAGVDEDVLRLGTDMFIGIGTAFVPFGKFAGWAGRGVGWLGRSVGGGRVIGIVKSGWRWLGRGRNGVSASFTWVDENGYVIKGFLNWETGEIVLNPTILGNRLLAWRVWTHEMVHRFFWVRPVGWLNVGRYNVRAWALNNSAFVNGLEEIIAETWAIGRTGNWGFRTFYEGFRHAFKYVPAWRFFTEGAVYGGGVAGLTWLGGRVADWLDRSRRTGC